MPSSYPAAFDILANPGPDSQMNDPANLHSALHSGANDAIEAVQQTLGLNPQGSSASVAARFSALPLPGKHLGRSLLDNVNSTSLSWSATTWTSVLSVSATLPANVTAARCVLHGGSYISVSSYGIEIGFGTSSSVSALGTANRIVVYTNTPVGPHFESTLTGLTAGATYTFYALVRSRHSSYSHNWYYGGSQYSTVGSAQGSTDYGPIIFEVFSA